MPRHPYMLVDAFTTTPLSGNPCAVILDADDLDETAMLAIAREMNLSETAFVLHSNIADVRARYFTPMEEIPLAGHPTIATIFALTQWGRLRPQDTHTTISLELQVGTIPIEIFSEDGAVQRVVMSQKSPQFLRIHAAEIVMPLFGLTPDDAIPGVPIQTVSTGTPQLMVPVRDHDALRRAEMHGRDYTAYRAGSDFFSPHLFTLGGATPEGDTFARHFGVPPDTMEDPFTGSATGGMAAYLWHYGLITAPRFVAQQGHWMQRPGLAFVEVVGPREAIATVKVGGSAVEVIRGEILL